MDDIIRRCHEILHLPETATRQEIRDACNKIVHSSHLQKEEWGKTKEIDWACETLMRSFPETEENDQQDTFSTLLQAPHIIDVSLIERLKDLVFAVEEKTDPLFFGGRVILFFGVFIWGWVFILKPVASNYAGESFLHLINLPFHEAGHILFSFFGRFLHVLGGSLLQVIIPAVCLVAFLMRREPFSASIGLWWVGQSFIDMAPYISDARAGQLMLIGGVTGQEAPDFHDWNVLLGMTGLLNYDGVIAHLAKYFGVVLILLALLWGGCSLWGQYKNIRGR
jgi:hypothetical protein